MALGSDLTLKDKILNVSLEKPLLLMKDASNEVKAMTRRLEPLKDGSIKVDMSDLYSQNPILLQWLDIFRTFNWNRIKEDLEFSGILALPLLNQKY